MTYLPGRITIGKSKNNNIIIEDITVSRQHCTLRMTMESEIIIEDLDSSNGTYVNGKRIKQASVKAGDLVKLGDFEIELPIILPYMRDENMDSFQYIDLLKEKQKKSKEQEIYKKFIDLRQTYNNYIASKKKILRGKTVKSTGIRAALSLIPFVGIALGTLSSGLSTSVQEKILELDEQFKKDYVCPSCFKFLGMEPFENLEKRGYCFYCRSKWLDGQE